MKKLLTCLLLLGLIFASFAQDKVYPKIGKYKNVKVTGITWKGIRIQPEGERSFYITDKDLSAEDQAILQEELKIWRTKAAKHGRRRTTEREIEQEKQETELRGYLLKIPGWSKQEIYSWAQKLTEESFDSASFLSAFQKKFDHASNREDVLKAARERLKKIENDFLENAISDFNDMNITQLYKWSKAHAGIHFEHEDFINGLQKRYRYASICDRVKQALMDRDMELLEDAWKYLKKVAHTKSGPEINRILRETLEVSITSSNLKAELLEIFHRMDRNEIDELYHFLVQKEKDYQIAEQKRREEEARRRAEEERRRAEEERRRIEERNRRFAQYDKMTQQELREEVHRFLNSFMNDERMKVSTRNYWFISNPYKNYETNLFFDVVDWEIYGVTGRYSSRYNEVRVMVKSSNRGGSPIRRVWIFQIRRNENSMRWEIINCNE